MTKKEIKQKTEESIEYLNSVSRYYQGKVFCVNVKRHFDDWSLEDVASKYTKRVKSAILEEFNDERVDRMYWDWLSFEADYFVDDYLKQNCTDSDEVKKHMAYLSDDYIGFYGRSGGWFGVDSKLLDELEEVLLDLEDYTLDEVHRYHDIDGLFAHVEAVKWVLDEADKFNRGLTFKDELEYRVEEYADEVKKELQCQREITMAKTLAERNGFVLAKTI